MKMQDPTKVLLLTFFLYLYDPIDGKFIQSPLSSTTTSSLDLCFQECTSALMTSLSAEDICTTMSTDISIEAAKMLQQCQLGFDIGTEIGCIHRCKTSRSEWTLDAKVLRRAQAAACGVDNRNNQPSPRGQQHFYADCHYGFEAVLKNIFRLWNLQPSSESTSSSSSTNNRYVVYPVQLPSQSQVYVYWEDTETSDDVMAKATRFCVHLALGDAETEMECGRQLIGGLTDRMFGQEDWRTTFPRILLLIPLTVDNREMRLVVYEGQSAVVTALEFCAQLELPSTAHQDTCVDGILPILRHEIEQATGY